MKSKLDTNSKDWSLQYYLNPNGNHVLVTLGAHADRIRAGKRSEPRRDTCAYIYHVHEGSGSSKIITSGGENITIHWE